MEPRLRTWRWTLSGLGLLAIAVLSPGCPAGSLAIDYGGDDAAESCPAFLDAALDHLEEWPVVVSCEDIVVVLAPDHDGFVRVRIDAGLGWEHQYEIGEVIDLDLDSAGGALAVQQGRYLLSYACEDWSWDPAPVIDRSWTAVAGHARFVVTEVSAGDPGVAKVTLELTGVQVRDPQQPDSVCPIPDVSFADLDAGLDIP